jgi:hypothetical protein
MPSIHLRLVLLSALALVGCTASTDAGHMNNGPAADGGRPGSPASAGGGADSTRASAGGESAGGAGGESAGGTLPGTAGHGGGAGAGEADGGGGARPTFPPGPAGCGLEQAAFCDTFDAPADAKSRAGELAPEKWSAARFCNIGGPSSDDEAVAIGAATVPTCRDGLPQKALPSADALICDATSLVHTSHLLVLTAAQNYGQNSYRIRQPFEFSGRTGTIVFDAEGHNVGNQGWVSVEITEDPAPAPSFALQQNFENGSIPRNAVEIHLNNVCGGDNVGIYDLFVYDDYHQDLALTDTGACVPAGAGQLNHFEVKLSQTRVEVYGTPASSDGVSFGTPVLLGAKDIALSFSRGYVHLTTHNHATLKYSGGTVDAWTARWDNVGFDGPAITSGWREYGALDPLQPTQNGKVNVAWRVAKSSDGPDQKIEIPGVEVSGATRARLALQHWTYHVPGTPAPSDYSLDYRLNGHAWKHRLLSASEQQMMLDLPNAGTLSLVLDVDVADLTDGTNTVEFTTTNATSALPPVVLNIDLILE